MDKTSTEITLTVTATVGVKNAFKLSNTSEEEANNTLLSLVERILAHDWGKYGTVIDAVQLYQNRFPCENLDAAKVFKLAGELDEAGKGDQHDLLMNLAALLNGGRIMASYEIHSIDWPTFRVWGFIEHQSDTEKLLTWMLPDEY